MSSREDAIHANWWRVTKEVEHLALMTEGTLFGSLEGLIGAHAHYMEKVRKQMKEILEENDNS